MSDRPCIKTNSFFKLTQDEHVKAVNGYTHAEAHIILAWKSKWMRITEGEKYSRPVVFGYKDVKHLNVSESTFRRTMRKIEGTLVRKVIQGGGRSTNRYIPAEPAFADQCKNEEAAPAKMDRQASHHEPPQGGHLKIHDVQEKVLKHSLSEEGGPECAPEIHSLCERIINWAAEPGGHRQDLERPILEKFMRKHGPQEVLDVFERLRASGVNGDRFYALYDEFPSDEIPF